MLKKINLERFLILVTIAYSFIGGFAVGSVNQVSHTRDQSLIPLVYAQENDIPSIPRATIKIPILIYHYVEYVKDSKDTIRKSLNIQPELFEAQLKTLIDAGYNYMFMADLGQYLDGKKALPKKPIAITFDDGYEDFYTDVFPILKKYKIPVTSYIISGSLGKKNYMSSDELLEIAKSGLVEIGAHTVNHLNLKTLSSEGAKNEIVNSKTQLENTLGIFVVSFAYPYGSFNDEDLSIVKKAGFTTAVSTLTGTAVNQENRFSLFRIHPGIDIGEELLRRL